MMSLIFGLGLGGRGDAVVGYFVGVLDRTVKVVRGWEFRDFR